MSDLGRPMTPAERSKKWRENRAKRDTQLADGTWAPLRHARHAPTETDDVTQRDDDTERDVTPAVSSNVTVFETKRLDAHAAKPTDYTGAPPADLATAADAAAPADAATEAAPKEPVLAQGIAFGLAQLVHAALEHFGNANPGIPLLGGDAGGALRGKIAGGYHKIATETLVHHLGDVTIPYQGEIITLGGAVGAVALLWPEWKRQGEEAKKLGKSSGGSTPTSGAPDDGVDADEAELVPPNDAEPDDFWGDDKEDA